MKNVKYSALRMTIGFSQGLLLLGLYRAHIAKSWPATDGSLYAALLVSAVFVPLVVIVGLRNFRPLTLATWTFVVAIICATLAAYDIYREPIEFGYSDGVRHFPSVELWFFLPVLLFIVHSYISASDFENSIFPSYPRYFEIAWKHATQILLSILFIGMFWALALLSASLFELIHINFTKAIIKKDWFIFSATAISCACCLDVTDRNARLIVDARNLALTLLSWLLPIFVIIVCLFLQALVYTGLQSLWSTRYASVILLSAAAALILLVNAAYQDGRTESSGGNLIHIARMIGAMLISPLVLLACYAVFLRVSQYGLTPHRVIVIALLAITLCFAGGYSFAAIKSRLLLKELETTNISAAIVAVFAMILLFSPVADPLRLSVENQLSRLRAGKIPPKKFDFGFLRKSAGRYGTDALKTLAEGADVPEREYMAARAKEVLSFRRDQVKSESAIKKEKPVDEAENLPADITVVYPKGRNVPENFLHQDWERNSEVAQFFFQLDGAVKAKIALIDLDGDGVEEVIILHDAYQSVLKEINGRWTVVGSVGNCKISDVAVREGKIRVVDPIYKDIEADGRHMQIRLNRCHR